LLAFARKQTLAPVALDGGRLIAGMEGLLRRTLGENIGIEFVQAPQLWQALADPSQLENAVLNLCINARDAMEQGGHLTIETANATLEADYASRHPEVTAGQFLMIAVSDTGKGISPENLKRVFEPFFTTKELGKGTGLGLSMVYGFIKQSQGHINVYSEVGHGTTVRLYLPRTDAVASTADRVPESATTVGGSEKILLVEDDEFVRSIGERLLTELGYHVVSAANGPEALTLLRSDADFDLMFTDIMMPGGFNGRELAQAACKLRPTLNILYTSGYSSIAAAQHVGLVEGQLLSKPYQRSELAQKIRAALTRRVT
jgi:CheY-like chemotaxis protein